MLQGILQDGKSSMMRHVVMQICKTAGLQSYTITVKGIGKRLWYFYITVFS